MPVDRDGLIRVLAAYRRPGSPVYSTHFRRLPAEILDREHVPLLIDILVDGALPAMARDHAAGALGEIGDGRAVEFLVEALASPRTRRGAAVALGRMRALAAREALADLAPKVKVARWALSELGVPDAPDEVIEYLREGPLHEIRHRVARLSATQKSEVERELVRELGETVSGHNLAYGDGWMVTSLRFLNSEEAGPILARALLEVADPDAEAMGLRTRLIRAISALAGAEVIPLLVQFTVAVDNPIHKHLAASCIEKITRRDRRRGTQAIRECADQIDAERDTLENALRHTPTVAVERPWHRPEGSPGWTESMKRAIKALENLTPGALGSG